MKFNYETHKQKCERLKVWHKWFAWYPVEMTEKLGEVRWLETVERRKGWYSGFGSSGWWTEYREVSDE